MMKTVFFLVLVTLFSVYADDAVIVGTTDNFDSLITDNEFVLVEFYAPWCGHCKNLEPEYKKAAATLEETGSGIKLVKVDATVETELAQKFEVKGYPTLLFFRSGEHIPYEGDRTAAGIVSWVTKKSGPPSVVLADAEAVAQFVQTRPAVVGTFPEGSDALEVFVSVAKVEDDFRFGNVVGEQVSVTLYTSDEGDKVYEGEMEKDALKAWLKAEGYPVLQELDQNVWQRATIAQSSIFVAFIDTTHEASMETVGAVAKEFKGKITATYMDAEQNAQLAERWGASGKAFPTAVIISYENEEPALITWDEDNEADFSVEALTAFVKAGLAGEYSSYKKSEAEPETNDEPVYVLVGKTLEAVTSDATKDVFVEFYAPWCGHCKKLAPIYDELGAKFAGVDSVVIAKIDATANYVPEELGIRGFPTLYFFPAGENAQPIQYQGARELEDMAAFIQENAGTQFTLEKEDL
eukprot:TRINITY_DN135_c1_g1_i1.p1 TRINITY_DN135_c1_g1~~TRINITY_DN135_c1_g1_i1.p1  ORF type:complete len:465 (-),score=146.67 TRINITY_DN135_c1_g1_i1:50-1444(-)